MIAVDSFLVASPTAIGVVAGIDVDIESPRGPVRCELPTVAADAVAGAGTKIACRGIGGSSTRLGLVGTGSGKNGHVGRGCGHGIPVDKGIAAGTVMAGGTVGLPGKARQQEMGLVATAAVGERGSIWWFVVAGVTSACVQVGGVGRMANGAQRGYPAGGTVAGEAASQVGNRGLYVTGGGGSAGKKPAGAGRMCCIMAVMTGTRIATEGTGQGVAAVADIALGFQASVILDGVRPAAAGGGATSRGAKMALEALDVQVMAVTADQLTVTVKFGTG